MSTLDAYATGNEARNLAELCRLGIFELSERTAIILAQMLSAVFAHAGSAALFGHRALACTRPDELAAMTRRFAEADLDSGDDDDDEEAAAQDGAAAGPSAAAGESQDGEAVFDTVLAAASSGAAAPNETRCGNCGCPESETPKMTVVDGASLCNLCNKYQREHKGTARPTALEKKRKDNILRRVAQRDKKLGEKRARASPLSPGGGGGGGGGGLLWRVRLTRSQAQAQLGSTAIGERRSSLRLRPADKK
jgi:hypothetical protein